jgi:tRNA(fMet)-specific endonuclease VapC
MGCRAFHGKWAKAAQDAAPRDLQVNFLLDTNACIALINGKPSCVRRRFQTAIATGGKVFVPSIVAFELWYGAAKSSQPEANRQRLGAFFAGPIAPLAFDDEDAQSAGAIRAALEVLGKPIGAYDLLIAGQALQRKFTLVTANVTKFARVKGLAWQDWSKPS